MSSSEWEEICGIRVRNPVLLAAGVLGETYGLLKRMENEGAGGLVTKSIGPIPNPGYAGPIMVEVRGGFLNAVGLANPGAKAFAVEMLEGIEEEPFGVPVIVSVYGGDQSEFHEVISGLDEIADGFELNLSCPHSTEYGLTLGSDPDLVTSVVRASVRSTNKPVFAKLSPNVQNITEVALAAEKGGAHGLVAINSVGPGMTIELESGRPILSNKVGGLSGPCIKPLAVRCIYEIYGAVKIPIIGVGGVNCANDAIELMEAGATWVQVGSGLYGGNLHLFRKITRGIDNFLDTHHLSHPELIGRAHGGK